MHINSIKVNSFITSKQIIFSQIETVILKEDSILTSFRFYNILFLKKNEIKKDLPKCFLVEMCI